jgi:hypothetical protein
MTVAPAQRPMLIPSCCYGRTRHTQRLPQPFHLRANAAGTADLARALPGVPIRGAVGVPSSPLVPRMLVPRMVQVCSFG